MGGEIVDDTDDGPVPTSGPLFSARAASAAPHPYAFFPQGGTLWQDLVINNHVDLATARVPFDFDCTDRTYAGHRGHDSDIVGFREQEIGVPIFAPLDGTVVSTHDGEYQHQHAGTRPARKLRHPRPRKRPRFLVLAPQEEQRGGKPRPERHSRDADRTHWQQRQQHLAPLALRIAGRRGSVRRRPPGRAVGGASYWVNQVPVRQTTFVKTFTFASAPFSGSAGYPYDQVTHSGTYVLGTVTTYFRMSIANWPVGGAYPASRYTRPNGTTALDFSDVFVPGGFRNGWLLVLDEPSAEV